jgi:hypothetical protein
MFNYLRIRPSMVVWLFILVFMGTTYNLWRDWRGGRSQFISDVDQYYSYLPAVFVHHDLKFNFPNSYWLVTAPNGQGVAKGTMGMSLLYSPFFLIAHGIAKVFDYPADGYSKPYVWSVYYGTLIYSLLALLILRRALRYYFSEKITALTLAVVFFGTNLMYYTLGWGEMPHSYLFFLYSALIYLTIKWHHHQHWRYMTGIAFISGMATLIRPSEGLVIMIPLLFAIYNRSSFNGKMVLLWRNKWQLLVAAIVFVLPLLPQLFYWKYATGNWVFYSYGESERFFFNDPKLLDVLFSYRKGWLLYTPLMALALAGFFTMKIRARVFFIGVLLFFLINLYLLSSWWSWWYGGSYGMRSFVQYYAFFAFPMAAFFAWVIYKLRLKMRILVIVVLPFIALSLFQTYQYKKVYIHWDSMTKEAYWMVFGRLNLSPEESARFNAALKAPDYDEARKGPGR